MRTERNFIMKKDFFVMMTESKADKFVTSIAMGNPLTEDTFFDSTGTSEFIRFYSSNTSRTITERAEKKSELSINQKMTTITWDFFKNNGDFLAQLITFISIDGHDPIPKQFLENFKTKIDELMENILASYISKKNYDIDKTFADKITLVFGQNQSINITCIFTMLRPELIESQLPKDCDVFLENDEFTFEDFRTQAKKCYLITTDNKLKLVIRESKNYSTTTQEIKCPHIAELREALVKLNLQGEDGFFPFNKREEILKIILKFVPAEVKSTTIKSQKGESAYSTVVINSGKHRVTLKESTQSGSWISKLISFGTIQHYRKDDIIQIESQDDLLAEEKIINFVDQKSINEFKKDEKYFERLYPTSLKSKLLAKAEQERSRIYQSWTQSTTKIWLSVISRLFVFQKRLQDSNFKPELQPEDPIYQRLREASLDSFWSFAKALEMTEIDDSDVIQEQGLMEIKNLWETESKDQKLGWFEAFKKRYPGAPLHSGKEIAALTFVPNNHVRKIRNFSALPISTDVTKQLKTLNYQLSRDQSSIIFSEAPSILEAQLTLDTIREFHYMWDGQFRAKLTVLYSPRFIEEKGWQQHMKDTCDLVLSSLAKKIFDNFHLFSTKTEELPHFITSVLSQSPYNEVKASILLCLTVDGTKRYLVSIGNCLALSFKNEQCTAIIGARYSEKGVPVLLNSLNKPDDPRNLIPSSSVRKHESVQIVVIPDSKEDIFLISGRAVALDFLKPNPKFESKLNFKEYDLDIDKLLGGTEAKDQKMVDNVIKALQNHRRKFLDIIENPSMISAWKKIEDLLRGQQFKSVEIELTKLVKQKQKELEEPESESNENQDEDESPDEDEETQEEIRLKNFYSQADKVNKCTTATDLNLELEALSQEYYGVQYYQHLFSGEEILMVAKLWSIAEIETKGFPESKHTDQVELTWTQVRGRYFLYFQGVKDLIAIANPSSSLGCRVKLFQHINAFADQAFYPLQLAGKKQEALEIQTFKQIICAIGNDNLKIYNVLHQKLKFLDSNLVLGFGLSGFWVDLLTLLVATKLIHHQDNYICAEDYRIKNVIHYLSRMAGLDSNISNFGAITLIPPPARTQGNATRPISENNNENKYDL